MPNSVILLVTLSHLTLLQIASAEGEACSEDVIMQRCAKQAEAAAHISGLDDHLKLIEQLSLLISNQSTILNGCVGWMELWMCTGQTGCKSCNYSDALSTDVIANRALSQFAVQCNFGHLPTPFCSPQVWTAAHPGEPAPPGSCLSEGDKLDCAQAVTANAQSWNSLLYSVLASTLPPTSAGYEVSCRTLLKLAVCELTAGCSSCSEAEVQAIQRLYEPWITQPASCSQVEGVSMAALQAVDCTQVTITTTTGKTATSKGPTSKPNSSKRTSKQTPKPPSSSSTKASNTVIIVVSVLAVLIIIIIAAGCIIVYCLCCADKNKKGKKPAGKQKMAASSSKMGGKSSKSSSNKSGLVGGKSTSSASAQAAQPSKAGQLGAASSKNQSVLGGSKMDGGSKQVVVSKSKV